MKRKRGHKKGRKSKTVTDQGNLNESIENVTSEQSSDAPAECENSEIESKMEIDAPSSNRSGNTPITDSPVASVDPVKSVGRVKVKLKSSKPPEPDVSSHTDILKKKEELVPQAEPEKPGVVVEKKEESVPRVPERKPVLNVYRKTKGIKIKSSKPVDGSSSVTEVKADAVKSPDANVLQKDTKTVDDNSQAKKQEPESAPTQAKKQEPESAPTQVKKQEPESTPISVQNEQKKTDQNAQYNKQELEDSLTVIKKIMKMEAADPFNVPVNPQALGIPDYFDIIKTPMDFGTICNSFEKGDKYLNSEDVYKDVQYIWNNCSKYNKKGDYIVDLMKRVKKNFMKYWTAAGLFTEQSAAENSQLEDGGKASTKGSQSKQKSHKRHGRHHKSDCMCAICILKRRKRERQQDSPGHSGAQEESSPVGSPSVGNSSINMGEEQDMDVDAVNKTGQGKPEVVELDSPVAKQQRVSENKEEVEEEEEEEEEEAGQEEEENVEAESENKTEANVEDKTQPIDSVMEESGRDEPVTSPADKLVVLDSVEDPKSIQNEKEEKEKRLREQKELERKEWRAKLHEKFQVRNPKLISLCETLFPNNNKNSVWTGPHSLFKRRGAPNRSSSLHKAVEALMK